MTETAIVKPLEWDGNKAETPYGTYRYEWQTGAGAQDGYYKAELNFDIIVTEKRCDWPEIQEACEAYHQKVIADTLDLTAYRKAIRKEALEEAATILDDGASKIAATHNYQIGNQSFLANFATVTNLAASIRALAEKDV